MYSKSKFLKTKQYLYITKIANISKIIQNWFGLYIQFYIS